MGEPAEGHAEENRGGEAPGLCAYFPSATVKWFGLRLSLECGKRKKEKTMSFEIDLKVQVQDFFFHAGILTNSGEFLPPPHPVHRQHCQNNIHISVQLQCIKRGRSGRNGPKVSAIPLISVSWDIDWDCGEVQGSWDETQRHL